MFINYSNHPSAGWMDEQKNEASTAYGRIADVPFPAVPVEYTSDEVRQLAEAEVKSSVTNCRSLQTSGML